jgi:hypothetical protein
VQKHPSSFLRMKSPHHPLRPKHTSRPRHHESPETPIVVVEDEAVVAARDVVEQKGVAEGEEAVDVVAL